MGSEKLPKAIQTIQCVCCLPSSAVTPWHAHKILSDHGYLYSTDRSLNNYLTDTLCAKQRSALLQSCKWTHETGLLTEARCCDPL